MNVPSLKSYIFDKVDLSSYFPPILDYDPVQAAQDLTSTDLKICTEIIQRAFKSIHENKREYLILEDCILFSQNNFMWFVLFLKELEKLSDLNKSHIPYDQMPQKSEEELFFFPPCHLWDNHHGQFRVAPDKIKIKNKDIVNLHRVKYILQDYELEDFRDGFPNWYILKQQTIYETYNEKTNVRVRIDYLNGEFLYFIAGASDCWQQIKQVPVEIDHIISSFLFRG